jgi:hypothetical protein
MKKPIHIVPMLLYLSIILTGCSDRWQSKVYLNKQNLTNYRIIGEFSSIEECRDASLNYLRGIKALDTGDYECGKNCTYNSALDEYICEKLH